MVKYLLQCLYSKLGIISFLSRWQPLKLNETWVNLSHIISSFTILPSSFNFIHCPHFMNVFCQTVSYTLHVTWKCYLKQQKKKLYETHLGRGTRACNLLVFYAVCRILFGQEKEISFLRIQILQNAITEVKFMTDSSLCTQLGCGIMLLHVQNFV